MNADDGRVRDRPLAPEGPPRSSETRGHAMEREVGSLALQGRKRSTDQRDLEEQRDAEQIDQGIGGQRTPDALRPHPARTRFKFTYAVDTEVSLVAAGPESVRVPDGQASAMAHRPLDHPGSTRAGLDVGAPVAHTTGQGGSTRLAVPADGDARGPGAHDVQVLLDVKKSELQAVQNEIAVHLSQTTEINKDLQVHMEDLRKSERSEEDKKVVRAYVLGRTREKEVILEVVGRLNKNKAVLEEAIAALHKHRDGAPERLPAPPLISVRQLIANLGGLRKSGVPPAPQDIFVGSPDPVPGVRVPRLGVLRSIFLALFEQLADSRRISYLSAASGTGKTQTLADVWGAFLALRTGVDVAPGAPYFDLPWRDHGRELWEFASSVEVFGVTFNSNTRFLLKEADMCTHGGEFTYLPIYLRLIWSEYHNGRVGWEVFIGQVEELLGLSADAAMGRSLPWRLDVNDIAAEARLILAGRRGDQNSFGLLCVDELSQVCNFERPVSSGGGLTMDLSAALRSQICNLRDVAHKQRPMLVLFSSLSRLFMEAETKSRDNFQTTSGRTMVCAGALSLPTMGAVRDFFNHLRSVPGFKVSSSSPTSAPLDVDVVIECVSYLSGAHMRSMQVFLAALCKPTLRSVGLWELMEGALTKVSMSSSIHQIVDIIVRSPLLCAVALLGHAVNGDDADVVIPAHREIGEDGTEKLVPSSALPWEALVASTTIVASTLADGRTLRPSIMPSIFLSAVDRHARNRSRLNRLHDAESARNPSAVLQADENPVLSSLADVGRLFRAGTAAKGWEFFHGAWELSRSISYSYIMNGFPRDTVPRTFTLCKRYPAAHGVCGNGGLLQQELEDGRALLGHKQFSTIAELLALPPSHLVDYLWLPAASNFPALDAVVFHSRAGREQAEPLSPTDLIIVALQFKTSETTSDKAVLDLTSKFVTPAMKLPGVFGDHWPAWQQRVAFVAVANVRLSQDTSPLSTVTERVLERTVRLADEDQMTIKAFLDTRGANTILVARESMDEMYGSLFSGLRHSVFALVGAHVSTL